MPICHARSFIFFHIPRCAGTSVQKLCDFHGESELHGVIHLPGKALTLHHLTYTDILLEGLLEVDVLESYYKFTIIRDPFLRMSSDYFWQKAHDIHGEFSDLDFPDYLDLAESIINEQRYFEKVHYDHFRPITNYCLHEQALVMDEILILENLQQEIHRLPDSLDFENLPRVNRSPYDPSVSEHRKHADRVYELYREDKEFYDRLLSERRLESFHCI